MYQTIEEELDLHGQVLDDALHELKDAGLIEGSGGSGNQFRHMKPLPRAWAAVDKAILGFDIEANKLLIARWAAYESPITAETIRGENRPSSLSTQYISAAHEGGRGTGPLPTRRKESVHIRDSNC